MQSWMPWQKNIASTHVLCPLQRAVFDIYDWVSFGFGAGFLPASGTFGTFFGIPLALLGAYCGRFEWVFVCCVAVFFWRCCAVSCQRLGGRDHRVIVVDEILGFYLAVCLHPVNLSTYCLGFLLFRAWDISKFGPVGWTERAFKGSAGVMLDDVVAGLMSNICLFWFLR